MDYSLSIAIYYNTLHKTILLLSRWELRRHQRVQPRKSLTKGFLWSTMRENSREHASRFFTWIKEWTRCSTDTQRQRRPTIAPSATIFVCVLLSSKGWETWTTTALITRPKQLLIYDESCLEKKLKSSPTICQTPRWKTEDKTSETALFRATHIFRKEAITLQNIQSKSPFQLGSTKQLLYQCIIRNFPDLKFELCPKETPFCNNWNKHDDTVHDLEKTHISISHLLWKAMSSCHGTSLNSAMSCILSVVEQMYQI